MEAIAITDFEERVHAKRSELFPSTPEIEVIVSLRDLRSVEHIVVMTQTYLNRLLRMVTLTGHTNVHPYQNSRFALRRMDPPGMALVQTFVQRRKLLGFLESFDSVFDGHYVTGGFANQGPAIVIGKDSNGQTAVAHYLPPIIELRESRTLLDGIHRNFAAMRVGTPIVAIHIYNVEAPLPCSSIRWEQVSVVDEKPPVAERFRDFRPEFFRDLKGIGIDG